MPNKVVPGQAEYRNPKQIQNPNVPMFETNSLIAFSILNVAKYSFGHLDFDYLILFRVSDFDIRIFI